MHKSRITLTIVILGPGSSSNSCRLRIYNIFPPKSAEKYRVPRHISHPPAPARKSCHDLFEDTEPHDRMPSWIRRVLTCWPERVSGVSWKLAVEVVVVSSFLDSFFWEPKPSTLSTSRDKEVVRFGEQWVQRNVIKKESSNIKWRC